MEVLKDKSFKTYYRESRYGAFPYYYHTLDNKYVYGTTAWLDDTTPYLTHKAEQNDTLDSLALHYYNNPTYFWVIADYNRIADPFEPLVVGDVLKIPIFSNIRYN